MQLTWSDRNMWQALLETCCRKGRVAEALQVDPPYWLDILGMSSLLKTFYGRTKEGIWLYLSCPCCPHTRYLRQRQWVPRRQSHPCHIHIAFTGWPWIDEISSPRIENKDLLSRKYERQLKEGETEAWA